MINFSTLQGLTIPVPQTVIPETSETSEIPLSDGDLFYGSYIVTVDGIEYPCETHTNSIGEFFLGDSRLYMEDDMSNPVDIPFYAVSWWTTVLGGFDEIAVCDVLYPDSETHTIEIKKMVDTSVTQIADASGRVLWKKAPATATITINGKGNGWHHYVRYNNISYYNANTTPSFQANIGDVIVCHCMLSGEEMSIYLNGILVAGKTGGTTAVDYSYTVVSDATIELAYQSGEYRRIIITEVPEGQITFTIDSTTYFAQENMTWAEWFASSYNTTGKTANDVQSISANGTAVALDAIIVGGMAYDIVFAEMVTVTITGAGNANYCYILIDGVSYATATSLAVPVGTTITAFVAGRECDCGRDGGQNTIRINDLYYYTSPKDYTVKKNVTINLFYESDDCKDCDDSWRDCFIQIIET